MAPLRYSVVEGDWPVTGALDPETGSVAVGTYLAPGRYAYVVRVSVSCGAFVDRSLETVVDAAPELPEAMPAAVADRPYEARLEIRGGTAPFSLTVAGLFSGLRYDAGTMLVTGRPNGSTGIHDLAVLGEDASGAPVEGKARVTVEGLPGGDLRIRVGGRDGSAGAYRLKIELKLPSGYGFALRDTTQTASVLLDLPR